MTAKLEEVKEKTKEKEEESGRYSKRIGEQQRELDSLRVLVREANGIAHRNKQEVAELTARIESYREMLTEEGD